jgi:LPS sulfotransferase NodH
MQEETMQPQSSYLICATPFDGSTFLCEALKCTGIAGCPEEYFGVFELADPRGYRENAASTAKQPGSSGCWNAADAVSSLASALEKGTSHNGVFGAKLLWSYFDNFVSSIRHIPMYREIPVFDLLPAVFPKLQYIWFTTRNKVPQAISLWKATQMAMWDVADVAERQFVFNFEAIDRFVQQLVEHEMEWLRFFSVCDIQPFIIVYEELISNFEGTMHEVLKYLELSPSENTVCTGPSLERHTDAVIALWCERYYRIKQHYSTGSLLAPYREE